MRKLLKFEEVDVAIAERKRKVHINTKTPAKRSRDHLINHYNQFHGATLNGVTLTQDATEVLEKVKSFNQCFATQLNKGQVISDINSDKIMDLKLEIGAWPNHGKPAEPVSVRVGLAELQDELDGLTVHHIKAVKCQKASVDSEGWKRSLQGVSAALSTNLNNIRNNVRQAVQAVEVQIEGVKGASWLEFQPVASLCDTNAIATDHDEEILTIKEQLLRMQQQIQVLTDGKQSGSGLTAITVGRHTFCSIKELDAWCE